MHLLSITTSIQKIASDDTPILTSGIIHPYPFSNGNKTFIPKRRSRPRRPAKRLLQGDCRLLALAISVEFDCHLFALLFFIVQVLAQFEHVRNRLAVE